MKKVVFLLMMMTVLLSSCGEYNKILKSTDYELKYSYAKKYFNAKQYSKSATLLDELVTIFKGTAYAEESLYLLAQSYYGQKDYQTAPAADQIEKASNPPSTTASAPVTNDEASLTR